jgi:hypothetical protein
MPSRGEDPNDESIANNTSNTEETVDETKGVVHHGFHIRKCQPVWWDMDQLLYGHIPPQ